MKKVQIDQLGHCSLCEYIKHLLTKCKRVIQIESSKFGEDSLSHMNLNFLIDNGRIVEIFFDDNSINLCLGDNFSIFSRSPQTCQDAFQQILTFIKLGVFIVA
jgi:hypothetical protein